jgi:2'-5' RNA ligase
VIRAFVGIRIDPEVTRRIREAQARLEKPLKRIRWVKDKSLHLTLKFLGEIPEERVAAAGDALERATRGRESFVFGCRGLGVFPDIRRPRVLWVGLEGKWLVPLAAAVDERLEAVGFARERREFKPHLTLGRWREFDGRTDLLRQQLEGWKDHDFGVSPVNEVIFFQSVLKPDGAIYTPLRIFPLGGNAG